MMLFPRFILCSHICWLHFSRSSCRLNNFCESSSLHLSDYLYSGIYPCVGWPLSSFLILDYIRIPCTSFPLDRELVAGQRSSLS
jgi:hypothetical protein